MSGQESNTAIAASAPSETSSAPPESRASDPSLALAPALAPAPAPTPTPTPTPATTSSYLVFAHLNAANAPLYRAILDIFVAKRAQFVISLRPSEILAELNLDPAADPATLARLYPDANPANLANPANPTNTTNTTNPAPDRDTILASALKQLHLWGNLDDTPDNAAAATIEDFYRNRRLYQLSAAGEAAEQALAAFNEYLHRPGELQTTALHDIISFLDALYPLLAEQPPDDAKLHQLLTSLVNCFEQLTTRAQSFMRGLHSTVELHGISAEAFLAYKERLVNYLENFISELVASTGKISATLLHLETCGLSAIAFPAAARREIANMLDPGPDALAGALERATAQWQQRWNGFRRWFISDGRTPSQAEHLRSRARSAIPALLYAVTQINDRRSNRADRAADFATLARWFAAAPDDASCHRLWRAAFALPPARHLRVNNETLDARATRDEHPRLSWLEAAPVRLSPRLRQQGHNTPRGPAQPVIDRTAGKQRLIEIARLQTAQIEHARQHLVEAGRIRLSQLGSPDTPLAEHPFRLFLELLGRALSRRRPGRAADPAPIDTESNDGTLRIRLEPIPQTTATIITTAGHFHGQDHWITITPAHISAHISAHAATRAPARPPFPKIEIFET